MRKAFGRSAGVVAMIIGLVTITLLILSVTLGCLGEAFPVMVVLGPLMVLKFYRHRCQEQERTTWEYLETEPISLHT